MHHSFGTRFRHGRADCYGAKPVRVPSQPTPICLAIAMADDVIRLTYLGDPAFAGFFAQLLTEEGLTVHYEPPDESRVLPETLLVEAAMVFAITNPVKYGRAQQSITNFSHRNAIRRAKQVQSDEYQGLGFAEKWPRLRNVTPGIRGASLRRRNLLAVSSKRYTCSKNA
jgi:hypothetical protein